MPTIRAVGVASPIAQGQAITSTLTAESRAWGKTAVPPASSHTANVSRLTATTEGTKTRAMRSTSRCTGAFEPCASCTMRMICASIVLRPTSSALKRKVPCLTMVPASTLSPCRFSTATGSPEIIDSSMKAEASPSTRPSTGMRSPGRTSMVSPGCRTEIGASVTEPFSTRWAVFGCSPIRARMAEAVPFLARSSMSRPVSTKVMIITEASNHVCHSMPRAPHTASPQNVLKVLKRKEMPVESATRVSILADRWMSCFHAVV